MGGRLGRIDTISLRYFNVFGPAQHPESKYAVVFPAFISGLVARRAPEVHWDGEQSRDFTNVGLLGERPRQGGGEVEGQPRGVLRPAPQVQATSRSLSARVCSRARDPNR